MGRNSTDSLGRQLIYDSDLNITWYDYKRGYYPWQDQVDWVSALTVNFGGNVYTDWRLPSAADGLYVFGFNGSTTAGYNITSSEMGHLFYTELGNKGYCDTSGNCPQPGWGLTNVDPFEYPFFFSGNFWSGTEYSTDPSKAWSFNTQLGWQITEGKNGGRQAIAVRSGDVVIASEPIRVIGESLTYYWSLQIAYDNASDGDVIQAKAAIFSEDIYLDDLSNKSVIIQGGYNNDFTEISGTTSISGDLIVNNGLISIENIRLQ